MPPRRGHNNNNQNIYSSNTKIYDNSTKLGINEHDDGARYSKKSCPVLFVTLTVM